MWPEHGNSGSHEDFIGISIPMLSFLAILLPLPPTTGHSALDCEMLKAYCTACSLQPLDKPPRPYNHAREWAPIPLLTARAAAVAARKTIAIMSRVPHVQVQRVAALQAVQQWGLSMLLALLPISVDLLAAAAGQVATWAAGAGGKEEVTHAPLRAYNGVLQQLYLLMPPAIMLLAGGNLEMLGLKAQCESLAVAGEAALRLAAQAAVLAQPLKNSGLLGVVLRSAGTSTGGLLSLCLLEAARQEVSAAPEPGRVRPTLQAQLRFVHTSCKFLRVILGLEAAASPGRSDPGHSSRGGEGWSPCMRSFANFWRPPACCSSPTLTMKISHRVGHL